MSMKWLQPDVELVPMEPELGLGEEGLWEERCRRDPRASRIRAVVVVMPVSVVAVAVVVAGGAVVVKNVVAAVVIAVVVVVVCPCLIVLKTWAFAPTPLPAGGG